MRIDWIRPGLLAGSPQPGLLAPLEKDAQQLHDFGFELLVNLTERPYELRSGEHDFEVYHFPILDMGVPLPEAMAAVCEDLTLRLDQGTKTLVHCKAGLGRTGTLLACLLVYRGVSPDDAMVEIRLVNSNFIQNHLQEDFVRRFAEYLKSEKAAVSKAAGDASA